MTAPASSRQPAGSRGATQPAAWTIGMIALLLVVIPALQTGLAGRNPWLNQLATGGARDAWWGLVGLTIAYQWVLVAAAARALRLDGMSWRDAGLASARWRPYAAALVLLTLGFLAVIMTKPGGVFAVTAASPGGALAAFLPRSGAERSTWLLLSLSAAATEEYLYRGFLIPRLGAWLRGGVGLAFLLSCLAFALAHNGWAQTVPELGMRLVLGAVLGALFLWRRTILPSVVLHYLSNAAAALAVAP